MGESTDLQRHEEVRRGARAEAGTEDPGQRMRNQERSDDRDRRDPYDRMGDSTMAKQGKSTRERVEDNVRIRECPGERRCDDILETLRTEESKAEQVRQ